MRVLVCGDRLWGADPIDTDVLCSRLAALQEEHGDALTIIEGEAHGADELARIWANGHGVNVIAFHANWQRYGRAAGPKRNERMLTEGRPHLVLAFHRNIAASKGTADMVRRAKRAGVPVEIVS